MARSESKIAETKTVEAKPEGKAKKAFTPKEKKAKGKIAITAAHYNTIKSPVITEKSTMAGEFGKYTFKVCVDTNKKKISEAVQALFGVEVTKVNVVNYDGKVKRFKQREGRRDAFKKAIVTLKSGQSIDLTSGLKG